MSTLIKNGIVVTESDVKKCDIFIDGDTICKIAPEINKECDYLINAEGKYVIPGAVDAHTHFNIKCGDITSVDDFYSGTVAAAYGGTTTIIDHMGFGPKDCNLHHQLKLYHSLAKDKAVVDYSFHGVIQHVNDSILNELKDMVYEEGIASFKIYTTYDYKISDYDAIRLMKRLSELNAVTCVHCENDGIIKYLKECCIKEGKTKPIYHAKTRPEAAEIEAAERMITLHEISESKATLYIVHISAKGTADKVRLAKQKGYKILGETCPQYLFLNDNMYNKENNEGLKYIMSPPLRNIKNNHLLFESINEGTIDTVATDHCSFNFNGDKKLGINDFTKCPNGGPGVYERLPLMFNEVLKNNISIRKLTDILCTNPSKIFGLYPKKGVIKEGSDADIVIIDPDKEWVISKGNLYGNVDYSAYEGMKIKGMPIITMVRGKAIIQNGEICVHKGYGKFIKRKI